MTLHAVRGANFGGWSALAFGVVTPINNLLKHEPVAWDVVITGAAFVFFLFSLIDALTDKLGSEIGNA